MNLFLIENDRSIDHIIGLKLYNPGDVIVCFNYLPYLKLKTEGLQHEFYFVEELLTPEDYGRLHSISDSFAFNWHRADGVDLTLFDGVSFGDLVKITFSRTYMLSVLLKYGEVIRKAVDRWPATENIYYDFSNLHNSFTFFEDDEERFFNKQRLVKGVSNQLRRKSVLLVPDEYIPSVDVVRKHSNAPKTIGERINRLIGKGLGKINAIHMVLQKDKNRIYFYNYFNTNSILDHASRQFILGSLDKNIFLNPKKLFWFKFLRFDEIRYDLSRHEKAFLAQLKWAFVDNFSEAHIDAKFIFNGIGYSFIYEEAIADLVINVMPNLMKLIQKVRKAIQRYGIGKVVVNEEIDEKMQAIIAACGREGTTSVWVDHGIQGLHHAQKVCDRGGSDIVACSGSFYTDYYRAQGAKGRRFETFGNPSMDMYIPSRRKKVSSIKNVLFLSFEDNFYARLDRLAYQEKYYAEIFPIFRDLLKLDIKIYFKPHPSYDKRYFEYLFNFFDVDMKTIDYITGVPFSRIVYDMDLVVSNVSNCFYESHAAGVPTVFFEPIFIPGSVLPPLGGVNGEEVIRISTGKDLLRIVENNKDNPEHLNKFLDNFLEKHAARYMGTLDGMAGERIAKFLEDL